MCYLSLTTEMPKSNASVHVIPKWASNLKSPTISNLRENQLLSCYLKSVLELSFRGQDVLWRSHILPQMSKRFRDCFLTFMGHVPVLK